MTHDPPRAKQSRFNLQTSTNWELFAGHRLRVSELVASASLSPRSLCVLGAGNCNDLDLPLFTQHFQRILLLDLDADALRRGLQRQFPQDCPAEIECRELDLLNDDLGAERFDCVLSACVISQLIETAAFDLGEQHPAFLPRVREIRTQHVRTLAQLTALGGNAILATDFVSSDTVPNLAQVPEADLPRLAAQCISEQNFFTGLNPGVLLQAFTEGPLADVWSFPPQVAPPWRWNLGPRIYLVTAITAQKKA